MDNLKRQRAYSLTNTCNVPHTPSRPSRTALANVNSASLVTPINLARRRANQPVTPQTEPPAMTKRSSLFAPAPAGHAQAGKLYASLPHQQQEHQSLCYGVNENLMMMNDMSLGEIDEEDRQMLLWEDQQQQVAQYNMSLYGAKSYGDAFDEDGFHAFYAAAGKPFDMGTAQTVQVISTSTPLPLKISQPPVQQQQIPRPQASQAQSRPIPSQCALCSRPSPSALLRPCAHRICTSCLTSSLNIVGEKAMRCAVTGCSVEVDDFQLVPPSPSPAPAHSSANSGSNTPSSQAPMSRAAPGRTTHNRNLSDVEFLEGMLAGDVVRSSTPRPSPTKDQNVIVLRIDNVPWDITPPGLQTFFSLPLGVLIRSHVLLDRKGKTLSHAFVEIKGEDWARSILRGDYPGATGSSNSASGPHKPSATKGSLGSGGSGVLGEGKRKRGVTITRGSMGELMYALFPSYRGTFESSTGAPQASQASNTTAGASRYPRYLLSLDEIKAMTSLIKEPTQFVKSPTLPIYALLSLLVKTPAPSGTGAAPSGPGSVQALGYVLGPDAIRALDGATREAISVLKTKYDEFTGIQDKTSSNTTSDTTNNDNAEVKPSGDDASKNTSNELLDEDAVTQHKDVPSGRVSKNASPVESRSGTPGVAALKTAPSHHAAPPFKLEEVEVLLRELEEAVKRCKALSQAQISSLLALIPAAVRSPEDPLASPESPSFSVNSSFDTSPTRSHSFGTVSKRRQSQLMEGNSLLLDGEDDEEFVSAMSMRDLGLDLSSSSFDSPYPRHDRSSSSSSSMSLRIDDNMSLPLLQSQMYASGKGMDRLNQSYAGYPVFPVTPAHPSHNVGHPVPSSSSPVHAVSTVSERAGLGLGRRVPSTHPGLRRSELRSASLMGGSGFAIDPLSPYANRKSLAGMGNMSMGLGVGMSSMDTSMNGFGGGGMNANRRHGPGSIGAPPGLGGALGIRHGGVSSQATSGHGKENLRGAVKFAAGLKGGVDGDDGLNELAKEFGVGVDVVEALAKRLGGRNVTF